MVVGKATQCIFWLERKHGDTGISVKLKHKEMLSQITKVLFWLFFMFLDRPFYLLSVAFLQTCGFTRPLLSLLT